MNEEFEQAKKLLKTGEHTCILCKDGRLYTSSCRGVSPLLDCLEQEKDFCGGSAADKVVGKAAAFLYLLLGIDRLYADVISQPALQLLQSGGIECQYDRLVPLIRNRAGDGFCPMESAVMELDDPKEALEAICSTLRQLQ